MITFIDRIAEDLLRIDRCDLSNTVVVMPGKTAPALLKKKLALANGKPLWSPLFFTLPELAEQLTGLKTSSRLSQIIQLYNCHHQLAGELHQSLDVFMQWAGMALDDFNEIDHHLVKPDSLFKDLRNIGEIQSWSFNSKELSEGQKKYMRFWDDLGKLYAAHCSSQEEQGMWTYAALARQIASEKIPLQPIRNVEHYIFAGHASYSPAELSIMQGLGQRAKVRIYKDQDAYYRDNIHHEAGYLLRKQQSPFDTPVLANPGLSEREISINLAESTSPVSQVFDLCNQIKTMDSAKLNESAIILSDSSLADPLCTMLDSMGTPYQSAFGLPLQRTQEARAVSALLHATKHFQLKQSIYIKDLLAILELTNNTDAHQKTVQSLHELAKDQVLVYLNQNRLNQLATNYTLIGLVQGVLESKNTQQALKLLIDFLIQTIGISENNSGSSPALNKSIEILHEVEHHLNTLPVSPTIDTVISLWSHLTSRTYLPYSETASEGIFILDISETLGLDFKTLYFLGANEGLLPTDSFRQSLIPSDVRGVHRLPLSRDYAAHSSYVFYRSLQRAEQLFFYHSSVSSETGGHERSRYLLQLEYELAAINKKVQIARRQIMMPQSVQSPTLKIETSEWIKQRLVEICTKGLSPSAINKFNSCKLDFFYRYVLGLGEEEELEEDLSTATIGSIVHKVLENFYKPFESSFPQRKDYMELKDNLEKKIEDALESEYTKDITHSGYNVLVLSVIEKMLTRFIDYEIKRLENLNESNLGINLKAVELPIKTTIANTSYQLRGFADRVEVMDGDHYILDYKTGKVEKNAITLSKSLAETLRHKDSGKVIQMLCYIYTFSKMNPTIHVDSIKTAFYSFRNHSEGWQVMATKNGDPISDTELKLFEEELVNWINDLIETPHFEHNPSAKFCSFCRT